MKNKRIALATALFAPLSCIYGQQTAQFSQFFYNKLYYNPAFASVGSDMEINATYRSQWMGVDGAPSTAGVNFKTPLFSSRGGLGANLYYDKAGNFSNVLAKVGYSYSLPLGRSALSIGLAAGMLSVGTDGNWVLPEPSPSDPSVPYGTARSTAPNISVGMAWYSEKYYVGLSSHNTLEFDNRLSDVSLGQKNHIYLLGGYAFGISRDVTLNPAALLATDMNTFSMSMNASVIVKEKIIAGLSYRTDDSIGLNLGYVVGGKLQIAYCYDAGLSSLSGDNSSGSHEILLVYKFRKTGRKVKIPPVEGVKNIRFL